MKSLITRNALLGISSAALGLLLTASPAQAGAIINLGTAGCSGLTCGPLAYTGGTLNLSAVGGSFQSKTFNGETGLGISGLTGGEIDVNETVNGVFSSAVTLDSFRLLFIYNGPEFGDPNEIAQVTVNGATVGTLLVNGENTAVWSLGGATVTSCGDTTDVGTGCFRVSNPFGGTAVSTIAFTALHADGGSNDSDYSLSSVEVTSVPEPASLLLLGTGLAAVRARRKLAQA